MAEKITKFERHRIYDDILNECDKVDDIIYLYKLQGAAAMIGIISEFAKSEHKEQKEVHNL